MGALDGIFPHANTVVCLEESKLLKRFQYEILYDASGIEGALKELNELNYFHAYNDAMPGNYGAFINALTRETLRLLKSIAPDEVIWRMFALYYDIHNMKLVVKERFLGKRLDGLALDSGSYSLASIRSAAVREDDNILQNDALTQGFFCALAAKDVYDVDFILDKTYMRASKAFAVQLGSEDVLNFVVERVDLFNISAFFQMLAAQANADYFFRAFSDQGTFTAEEWKRFFDEFFAEHSAGSADREKAIANFPVLRRYQSVRKGVESTRQAFDELDALIDNYLIDKTKAAKLMSFGVEPICAYFFNKLMEIKNIRILLTGKQNGYPIAEIKRRMRIPYEL